MGHRYIVLAAGQGTEPHLAGRDDGKLLYRKGLQHCLVLGPTSVFTADGTPTLVLPGGGILIGDLFSREGVRVSDATSFPDFRSHVQIRRHILEHCWGEYILVQPGADGDDGLTVLRDPSGSVQCVFSLDRMAGFITSDVSLAIELGLCSRRVDWEHMAHCLTYPHLKTQRTGLVGIQELLPGCSISAGPGEVAVRQEWSPWEFVASHDRRTDPREAAERIRTTVTSAVRAWVAPEESLLLEISGGLDSSIVATCLRDTLANVVCYTLVTPVPGADERQYAALVAADLGVELHAERLRFEDARFDFSPPQTLATPGVTALQFGTNALMEAAGDRHGVTGFVSGGGGDTVFGYFSNASPAVDALRARGLAAGLGAIRDISELHQCTFWKAGRLTLRKLLRRPKPPRRPDVSFLTHEGMATRFQGHPWFRAPAGCLPGDRERVFDLAGTQAFRDGLPRGESRRLHMPLLSQPVMEECLKVPSWMWIEGGNNRAVARAAFADALPPQILARRSKGTFVSYSAALFRRNKDQVEDFLLHGELQERGLLDAAALQRFFRSDQAPRDRTFSRMSDLCMIENWVRHQR